MNLWDPVLDEPSKHETFGERLVGQMISRQSRLRYEANLEQMVRGGRVPEAVAEAQASTYAPAIGLTAISNEQARQGNLAEAVATAKLINDPHGRAEAFIRIAETRRRANDPGAAGTALEEATGAARKIRGALSAHWRARTLAKIGLV